MMLIEKYFEIEKGSILPVTLKGVMHHLKVNEIYDENTTWNYKRCLMECVEYPEYGVFKVHIDKQKHWDKKEEFEYFHNFSDLEKFIPSEELNVKLYSSKVNKENTIKVSKEKKWLSSSYSSSLCDHNHIVVFLSEDLTKVEHASSQMEAAWNYSYENSYENPCVAPDWCKYILVHNKGYGNGDSYDYYKTYEIV